MIGAIYPLLGLEGLIQQRLGRLVSPPIAKSSPRLLRAKWLQIVRSPGPPKALQLSEIPLGQLESAPDVEHRGGEVPLLEEDIAMLGPENPSGQGNQPGVEGLGLVEPAGHLGRVGNT